MKRNTQRHRQPKKKHKMKQNTHMYIDTDRNTYTHRQHNTKTTAWARLLPFFHAVVSWITHFAYRVPRMFAHVE